MSHDTTRAEPARTTVESNGTDFAVVGSLWYHNPTDTLARVTDARSTPDGEQEAVVTLESHANTWAVSADELGGDRWDGHTLGYVGANETYPIDCPVRIEATGELGFVTGAPSDGTVGILLADGGRYRLPSELLGESVQSLLPE